MRSNLRILLTNALGIQSNITRSRASAESSGQMNNSSIYNNESNSNLNGDTISSNSSSNENSTQSTPPLDISGAARQLSLDQDVVLEIDEASAASTPRVVSAQRNRRLNDISESKDILTTYLIKLTLFY